jgi:2-iminobutanoate/2-iminopropanoate deaminase
MTKKIVATDKAPGAVGAYSQGVSANGLLFCSGQIPLDPSSGELVSGSIADETRRCLGNLTAVLEAGGSSWPQVVKVTAFLTDINDFAEFNEVYASYVGDEPPARAAFAVAALPKGARVEIECVAEV